MDDFADTIKQLLDAAWGPNWGEFTEEVTNFDDPANVRLPRIVFHLVSRKPNEKLTPLKKKFFQSIPDPLYANYFVEIWRKWFDCKIRFYCYGRTNRETRELSNKLEAFLDSYTGFFKERGLSELIFEGEEAPALLHANFGNLSAMVLTYSARVEEIQVVRGKLLETIALNIKPSE